MPQLSVIIPTLNEATYLPGLLDALSGQAYRPDEIIVADAGSKDGTAELALAHGARVVPGGMPAVGRNAGAQVATGELFQFFDADVLPHPDFVARALDEFTRAGYAVATCLSEPLSADRGDKIIMEATNLYLQVIQPISPRAPGYCILTRREVHQAIGGFDESLKLSEDHDYVRRASKYGEFGMLTSVRIPVSMRRLDKEGLTALALKYLWCEMHALAGKPIRSTPFEYEFGAFQPASPETERALIDVAELRAQLGRFENPLQRLSRASLSQLSRLAESDPLETMHERVRLLFAAPDLDTLDRYLQQRLSVMRENQALLREKLARFGRLPGETIRLVEPSWLRLRRGGAPQPEENDPKD